MEDNVINLIDENGVESQFEIILTLEAEGKEYAILMPLDDEEAEEALIFRIDQDEQGDILLPLENDDEYETVVAVYNAIMEEEGLNYEEDEQ
ncbi:DUF1292 domain-containing protein [Asaccharospora irregularis]|uniref:UPF0473 protein SAMN04488530_102134 n=1 Tax=Asaccharospora irregularis DSM 2635 TaxID=1121321 RepID=A0A1M5K5D2_9FIRM|nr:DUF1292 domain-containing protein [Asaccharospora irregularis]SHG47911.1 Protein of unknown function [Asaccharospora irregularis DSM 2635]